MAWLAAIPVVFLLVLSMEKFERHMLDHNAAPGGRDTGKHRAPKIHENA